MMPLWAVELAATFWSAAGGPEPPPRSLRPAIARALPLGIVLLPRLRLAAVDRWLRRQGIECQTAAPDRALRAALVARRGHGLIFLDGVDPPDEQRFSLAHELAHFLHNYWRPRTEALARLGPSILAVLDGDRPPTSNERIDAVLTGARLGLQLHLLDRLEDGSADWRIEVAERAADLLACELLAPAEELLASPGAREERARQEQLRTILIDTYGLPAPIARRYAAWLCPAAPPEESLVQQLGLRTRSDTG